MKTERWLLPFVVFATTAAGADFWKRVETLRGANVVSMAISHQGYIYVSVDPNISRTGGLGHSPLYRSTDKGQTWHYINFPPLTPRNLLASRKDSLLLASVESDVYRSTNGGIDWTSTRSDSTPEYINSMVLANNGTVYLSTYRGGVYRSTDFGATWTRSSGSFSQTEFVSVGSNGELIAGAGRGIYWSINDGALWRQIGLGETTATDGLITRKGTILTATYAGAYRSVDTGRTWTLLSFSALQIGGFAEALDGSIYLGVYYPNSTFRSTDDGKTWAEISIDTGRSMLHVLVGDSVNGQFAAVGASGIHRSTDGGAHWTQLPLAAFKTLTVYSANDGYMYTATSIGSFHARTDSLIWKPMNEFYFPPRRFIQAHDKLYAVVGDLSMSSDHGTTWSYVDYFRYYSVEILDIAQKPSGGLFVSATRAISPCPCAWGFYRSLDSGNTWSKANSNIFLKLAAASGGTIIAGSDSLLRSTDNGSTWMSPSSGLTHSPVTALAAARNGYFFAATELKEIYLSTDDGITWLKTAYNGGRVAEFTFNSSGCIFAATDSGVYRSADNGISWIQFNDGLPSLLITSISIDPQDYAYAATHMDGIFRSANPTTPVVGEKTNLPVRISLFQNYPNPFNPTTNFRFTIADLRFVSLKIYDILGREVATLVSERLNSGSYSVQWDATNFSSGVYFYRLTAGGFSETKKLSLIK